MKTRTQTPRTPDTLYAVWRRGLLFASVMCFAMAARAQPWHVNVLWQRDGLQDSSGLGGVFPLGDQNDDGYADWAISAYPPYGGADSAYAEFFHGGNPPDTQPYQTYNATSAGVWRFYTIWAIGDVNGDGYQDWAADVQYQETWQWFEVQIFYGGPASDLVPDALWHFRWQSLDEQFHPIGDFNGDGFDDLYKWRREGDVGFACFGSAAFDTIPDWSRTSPAEDPYQSYPEGHGDLNGDGYEDVVSTSIVADAHLYVFWGAEAPDTIPQPSFSVYWNGDVSVVNDLNGDGRDEVLEWGFDQMALHFGRDSLFVQPDVVLEFPCPYPHGYSVSLGDVNGDGYNDVILFAQDCPAVDQDYLALYLGNYAVSPQPAWVYFNRTNPVYLVAFTSVAGLGDINGDGINDIGIGGTNSDNDGTRGKCVILSGDTTVHVAADDPVTALPSVFQLSAYPNPFNAQTILSLEIPFGVGQMELSVVNVLGQTVSSQRIPVTQGRFEYHYDGRELASGVYVLRVDAGKWRAAKKVVLLK